MFSGVIEELGHLVQRSGTKFRVAADHVLFDARAGDYLAVNGCGVSVLEVGNDWFLGELPPNALETTTLGILQPGDKVNLERSLRVVDRMRGHFARGVIDGIGEVISEAPHFQVCIPNEWVPMVATKSAISIDGVSLSVVQALDDGLIALISDYTKEHTTLGIRKVGDLVNFEVEMVAKYVHRMIVLHPEFIASDYISGRMTLSE